MKGLGTNENSGGKINLSRQFAKRVLSVFLAVAMVVSCIPELGLKTVQAAEHKSAPDAYQTVLETTADNVDGAGDLVFSITNATHGVLTTAQETAFDELISQVNSAVTALATPKNNYEEQVKSEVAPANLKTAISQYKSAKEDVGSKKTAKQNAIDALTPLLSDNLDNEITKYIDAADTSEKSTAREAILALKKSYTAEVASLLTSLDSAMQTALEYPSDSASLSSVSSFSAITGVAEAKTALVAKLTSDGGEAAATDYVEAWYTNKKTLPDAKETIKELELTVNRSDLANSLKDAATNDDLGSSDDSARETAEAALEAAEGAYDKFLNATPAPDLTNLIDKLKILNTAEVAFKTLGLETGNQSTGYESELAALEAAERALKYNGDSTQTATLEGAVSTATGNLNGVFTNESNETATYITALDDVITEEKALSWLNLDTVIIEYLAAVDAAEAAESSDKSEKEEACEAKAEILAGLLETSKEISGTTVQASNAIAALKDAQIAGAPTTVAAKRTAVSDKAGDNGSDVESAISDLDTALSNLANSNETLETKTTALKSMLVDSNPTLEDSLLTTLEGLADAYKGAKETLTSKKSDVTTNQSTYLEKIVPSKVVWGIDENGTNVTEEEAIAALLSAQDDATVKFTAPAATDAAQPYTIKAGYQYISAITDTGEDAEFTVNYEKVGLNAAGDALDSDYLSLNVNVNAKPSNSYALPIADNVTGVTVTATPVDSETTADPTLDVKYENGAVVWTSAGTLQDSVTVDITVQATGGDPAEKAVIASQPRFGTLSQSFVSNGEGVWTAKNVSLTKGGADTITATLGAMLTGTITLDENITLDKADVKQGVSEAIDRAVTVSDSVNNVYTISNIYPGNKVEVTVGYAGDYSLKETDDGVKTSKTAWNVNENNTKWTTKAAFTEGTALSLATEADEFWAVSADNKNIDVEVTVEGGKVKKTDQTTGNILVKKGSTNVVITVSPKAGYELVKVTDSDDTTTPVEFKTTPEADGSIKTDAITLDKDVVIVPEFSKIATGTITVDKIASVSKIETKINGAASYSDQAVSADSAESNIVKLKNIQKGYPVYVKLTVNTGYSFDVPAGWTAVEGSENEFVIEPDPTADSFAETFTATPATYEVNVVNSANQLKSVTVGGVKVEEGAKFTATAGQDLAIVLEAPEGYSLASGLTVNVVGDGTGVLRNTPADQVFGQTPTDKTSKRTYTVSGEDITKNNGDIEVRISGTPVLLNYVTLSTQAGTIAANEKDVYGQQTFDNKGGKYYTLASSKVEFTVEADGYEVSVSDGDGEEVIANDDGKYKITSASDDSSKLIVAATKLYKVGVDLSLLTDKISFESSLLETATLGANADTNKNEIEAQDVSFTVTAENGYKLPEVSYKVGDADAVVFDVGGTPDFSDPDAPVMTASYTIPADVFDTEDPEDVVITVAVPEALNKTSITVAGGAAGQEDSAVVIPDEEDYYGQTRLENGDVYYSENGTLGFTIERSGNFVLDTITYNGATYTCDASTSQEMSYAISGDKTLAVKTKAGTDKVFSYNPEDADITIVSGGELDGDVLKPNSGAKKVVFSVTTYSAISTVTVTSEKNGELTANSDGNYEYSVEDGGDTITITVTLNEYEIVSNSSDNLNLEKGLDGKVKGTLSIYKLVDGLDNDVVRTLSTGSAKLSLNPAAPSGTEVRWVSSDTTSTNVALVSTSGQLTARSDSGKDFVKIEAFIGDDKVGEVYVNVVEVYYSLTVEDNDPTTEDMTGATLYTVVEGKPELTISLDANILDAFKEDGAGLTVETGSEEADVIKLDLADLDELDDENTVGITALTVGSDSVVITADFGELNGIERSYSYTVPVVVKENSISPDPEETYILLAEEEESSFKVDAPEDLPLIFESDDDAMTTYAIVKTVTDEEDEEAVYTYEDNEYENPEDGTVVLRGKSAGTSSLYVGTNGIKPLVYPVRVLGITGTDGLSLPVLNATIEEDGLTKAVAGEYAAKSFFIPAIDADAADYGVPFTLTLTGGNANKDIIEVTWDVASGTNVVEVAGDENNEKVGTITPIGAGEAVVTATYIEGVGTKQSEPKTLRINVTVLDYSGTVAATSDGKTTSTGAPVNTITSALISKNGSTVVYPVTTFADTTTAEKGLLVAYVPKESEIKENSNVENPKKIADATKNSDGNIIVSGKNAGTGTLEILAYVIDEDSGDPIVDAENNPYIIGTTGVTITVTEEAAISIIENKDPLLGVGETKTIKVENTAGVKLDGAPYTDGIVDFNIISETEIEITGKKVGTTTYSVTYEGGVSSSTNEGEITVVGLKDSKGKALDFNEESGSYEVGDASNLFVLNYDGASENGTAEVVLDTPEDSAILEYNESTNISFVSGNTAVATVAGGKDDNGTITAVKSGTAEITVTYKVTTLDPTDKKGEKTIEREAEIKLDATVIDLSTEINVQPMPLEIMTEESGVLKVSYLNSDGVDGKVYDIKIAKDKDEDGVISGNPTEAKTAAGATYTFTASKKTGSATYKITVTAQAGEMKTPMTVAEKTITVNVVVNTGKALNKDAILAITNYYYNSEMTAPNYAPTLKDLSSQLNKNWYFKSESTKLSSYAGSPYVHVPVYFDDGTTKVDKGEVVKIVLATIDGVSFQDETGNEAANSITLGANEGTRKGVKTFKVVPKATYSVSEVNNVVAGAAITEDTDAYEVLNKYFGLASTSAVPVEPKSSNESVVTAAASNLTASITYVAAGKSNVTFSYLNTTKTISVQTAAVRAEITGKILKKGTTELDKATRADVLNDYVVDAKSAGTLTLEATLKNHKDLENVKLSVSSSDTSVATVGTVEAGENGLYKAGITIKGSGTVTFTISANDELKTTDTVVLHAVSPIPEIPAITINNAGTNGVKIITFFENGYELDTINRNVNNTGYYVDGNKTDGYYLYKDGTASSDGKITITGSVTNDSLLGLTGETKTFSVDVLVTEVTQAITKKDIKVTQTDTPNFFFTGETAEFQIVNTKGDIEEVSFKKNGSFIQAYSYTTSGVGYIGVKLADTKMTESQIKDAMKKLKKLTFEVKPLGFSKLSDITVNMKSTYKAPKITLSSKSSTVNTAISTDARYSVKTTATDGGYYVDTDTFKLQLVNSKKSGADLADEKIALEQRYTVEGANGDVTITVPRNASTASSSKVKFIKITDLTAQTTQNKWKATDAAVYVGYTVNVKNKGNVSLNVTNPFNGNKKLSTITLNNNAQYLGSEKAVLRVVLSGDVIANTLITGDLVFTSASKNYSKGITFKAFTDADYEYYGIENDGALYYKVTLDGILGKGSYKFNIAPPAGSKVSVKNATVTVKVADTDMSKAVKLSSTGKIDIITPTAKFDVGAFDSIDNIVVGNGMIVTPKFNGYTFAESGNTITNVSIVGSRNEAMFAAKPDEDGKKIVVAKNPKNDVTKFPYSTKDTYYLTFKITLKNGITFTAPEMKFKMTQGKLAAKAMETTLVPSGATELTVVPQHTYSTVDEYGNKLTGKGVATFTVGIVYYDEDDDIPVATVTVTQKSQQSYVKVTPDKNDPNKIIVQALAGAKKGKTYSVKLEVKQAGQPSNVKNATTTLKVKIPK